MASARRSILLLCLALLAIPATGQQEEPLDGPKRIFQDALLERLVGTWAMVGAVRSRPATYSLHAEWVLNHQFLRLDMRDAGDPPAYQATVYIGYDNTSERYVAHWLDAGGGRFSETLGYGQRNGNAVLFVFEYPDGPFHTTFTLDAEGKSWSVLMQDRGKGGSWREFAHYTLTRHPAHS
ncbi:MAG TPA: DUF1579 family protein [Thermoanaerobaculia bacterium]|nr:DUF1579 family protein [Thermoanaerobaculia bacterium]